LTISIICYCSVMAQKYSMVVNYKDGKQHIYSTDAIDSVNFVPAKANAFAITDENGLQVTFSDRLSFEIDLSKDRIAETYDFYHVDVPCVEGVTIIIYKFNRHTADRMVTFYDCNGSVLSETYNGSGNGMWSYLTTTAPANTASVTIRFCEQEKYANRTKAYFAVGSNILETLISGAANSCKPMTIGYNGDSTGWGLCKEISNDLINDECVFFKGCIGGENVFATAARQGSIPMVIEPFTIPASSVARWTNRTSSIVAEGNDPEITTTPALLHDVTDKNGNAITQLYPYVYFDKSYPFYASVAGVPGYIYSMNGYTVNEDSTVTTDNTMHTYFHRLDAGDEVVINDTCHTVSKYADLFKKAFNVNMMGTNGGFFYFDDHRVVDTKTPVSLSQYTKNLCDIISIMDEYCGKNMLVVGMFCESSKYYSEAFYNEYDSICTSRFGNRFYNARKFLMEDAWRDLNITLSDEDNDNISKGLAPWCLFGDGSGKKKNDPHLTSDANKVLANRILNKMLELGWIKNSPKTYQTTAE